MIIDANQQFATLQDLGASTGTGDEISTNEIDLGTGTNTGLAFGSYWWIHVTENFAGASNTSEAMLVSDAVTAGHDTNSTLHVTSGTQLVGWWSTTGGAEANGLYFWPIPTASETWLRYVAIRWQLLTTELTAGIYSSGITADVPTLQTLDTGMNFV